MVTILIRTILIYIILVFSLRLMGKRQIAQLEISDLVSTLLLSEIAALPIENLNIPVSYAIIPTVAVMTFEIVSSALQQKFPGLKNLFSPRPEVLIRMGKPDFSELRRARMSADELMVALRRTGTSDIEEVAYAILEQDGSVSIIPRARCRPATVSDVGGETKETGLFHIIIDHGKWNSSSLDAIGREQTWAEGILRRRGLTVQEVLLMLANNGGETRIFTRGEEK